jgi:hypothetical protein
MTKILFILKRREDYNATTHSHVGLSTGLFNSASFVNDMLNDQKIESVIEVAIDNNCIDRLVTKHRPSHVIIEALWVVPTKFAVLQNLHPTVKWIIRLHSELPFIAGEGMAMGWLGDYSNCKNVIIACNAPRAFHEVKTYLKIKNSWTDEITNNKVIYLPNYYPQEYKHKSFNKDKDFIDIGCFGAIRPLKNHMVQAIAAVHFADIIGKKLRFHINSGRVEMNGQPHVNNLLSMFEHLYDSGHQLINHAWTPREQFLELCGTMDIGLQVSISETFNIVGADLISQGVPLIASDEIPWATKIFNADPLDSRSICKSLLFAYKLPQLNVKLNQRKLKKYTNNTRSTWVNYFKE